MVETHVFIDGNVIATRRSDYKKFVTRAGVIEIVRGMMQEQHKQMMKDLVDGKLVSVNKVIEKQFPKSEHENPLPPLVEASEKINSPLEAPVQASTDRNEPVTAEKTLDELILEYISKNKPS